MPTANRNEQRVPSRLAVNRQTIGYIAVDAAASLDFASNVRRKPSARRTSPFKKMMRKQTISLAVARAMRDLPDKGDRRRSVAQRIVNRKARARAAKLVRSGAITI